MRHTKTNLLAWAARWHYPYLCLGESDHVGHGELAWQRLARDRKRRRLAWKRIARWNELAQERSA